MSIYPRLRHNRPPPGHDKILEIFEGANELQQWIVARRLIGRDITG